MCCLFAERHANRNDIRCFQQRFEINIGCMVLLLNCNSRPSSVVGFAKYGVAVLTLTVWC
jgi:hypothetical protein